MEDELMHYGVKGMKWGVRRYQKSDGTLTSLGRRRNKAYKNQIQKVNRDLSRKQIAMMNTANNRAADKFNNGLLKRYNESWDKKHGTDDYKNPDYSTGYEKLYSRIANQEYNRVLAETTKALPSYKKAVKFVEKYEMESWSDLAKANRDTMRKLEEAIAGFNDDLDER